MFTVYCTVNLCICIYDLFHILPSIGHTDPRNVCVCVCVYVKPIR